MTAADRPVLVVDPAIQFGRVCVPNTRVPADVIAEYVAAGESVEGAMSDYELTRDEVLLCCWWYVDQYLRYLKRPAKFERRMLAAWDDWSLEAHRVLAGYDGYPGPLADPPELAS